MTEKGIFSRDAKEGDSWKCEQIGICKARTYTKGMEKVKRTNKHLQDIKV